MCSMHLNEFIDRDKFQVVDSGRSFCFSRKVRCPAVERSIH